MFEISNKDTIIFSTLRSWLKWCRKHTMTIIWGHHRSLWESVDCYKNTSHCCMLLIFVKMHIFNKYNVKYFVDWMSKCRPRSLVVTLWCSRYHYCLPSFNKISTQVLRRFRYCSWRFAMVRISNNGPGWK